jgi:hypothetical protein
MGVTCTCHKITRYIFQELSITSGKKRIEKGNRYTNQEGIPDKRVRDLSRRGMRSKVKHRNKPHFADTFIMHETVVLKNSRVARVEFHVGIQPLCQEYLQQLVYQGMLFIFLKLCYCWHLQQITLPKKS